MATSQISSTDLQNLRTGAQYIADVTTHITPLVSVASGSITAVPNLSPFVDLTVTFDSGQADVEIGQLIIIRDGSDVVSYAIARKEPLTNTLYISTTPLGSGGYARAIETAISAGMTFTVYTHRPIWGLYSRIANQTFFKSWDVPYTTQNETAPPVANTGAWQSAQVSVGSSATFRLPRVGSNTSFALGSATISSYAWSLPAGVTLASGFALSDSIIEVEAVAGRHLVSLTVTDSNAQTHTGYVWLFVSDGTTGTSLSERYALNITSDSQTQQGRELSIEITGDDLEDVIYPGAGILLYEDAIYNDTTLTRGVQVDTFIGYITEIEWSHDGNIGQASIRVRSPLTTGGLVQQPAQSVEVVANPSRWTETIADYATPQGFIYYAIKWHCPSLLDMHDLDISITTPYRANASWNEGSVQSAVQAIADLFLLAVGSASDGALVLRQKTLYLNNTDRNAIDTVIGLQEQDIQPNVTRLETFHDPFREARTGAFAFSATATKAWLAGKRWGQGVGTTELPNFTVTPDEGLPRLLEVVGHFYAEQNRPVQANVVTLTRNQDVIDPAYWLWIALTISNTYTVYGDALSSTRHICRRVDRQWSNTPNGILKTITLDLQPETFGQPGEEIPIPDAGNFSFGGFSLAFPTLFNPNFDDSVFGSGLSILAVVDDAGNGAITGNFITDSPVWNDVSGSVNNEVIHDMAVDYNSPYYANGNNANFALRLYVVTTDSDDATQLNVYRLNNILENTTATLLTAIDMGDSSTSTEARVEVSETSPTLAIVAYHNRTGVEFVRTTDGGATWSTEANVGDAITDNDNDNAPLGLDIDGTNQLVSAPNSSGEYGLYLATTAGGSFTRLSNTETGSAPLPLVKIVPDTDDTYASVITSATETNVIENWDNTSPDFVPSDFFDGVNADNDFEEIFAYFPSPTITGGASNITTYPLRDAGAGNPGACARWTPSVGTWRNVYDLEFFYMPYASTDDDVQLNSLTFDYYVSSDIANDVKIVVNIWDANTNTRVRYENSTLISNAWTTTDVDDDFTETTASGLTGLAVSDILLDVSRVNHILIEFSTSSDIDTSTNTVDIRLDNVSFSVGADGNVATLYAVADFDGTDSWSDISPATDEAPERPHDLAIDILDTNAINLVSGTSNNWYSSANGGTSYTTEESASDKRAFISIGDAILVGGDGEVLLSYDGGTTFEDKTGNLGTLFTLGVIKRILPL